MKLVHDSITPEAKAARHAADMRLLFAYLLRVAAGGSGIGEIPSLLIQARESFAALAGDFDAEWAATKAVKEALQPQFPDAKLYPGSICAAEPGIVRYSMRMVAHKFLGNMTAESHASRGLVDSILSIEGMRECAGRGREP